MRSNARLVAKGMGKPDVEDYTAVVYFHGMGQQRRHEEISGLVQQLDRLIGSRHRSDASRYPEAHLLDHHVYEEPGSDPSDPQTVVYQEVRNPHVGATPRIRFYEAYWAPLAVGGTNAVSVVLWATRQWLRPFAVLQAPWREMQALRLATLYGIFEQRYERQEEQLSQSQRRSVQILQHLMDSYRGFGQPETYTDPRFPGGTFDEFLLYLEDHPPKAVAGAPAPLPAPQIKAWAIYWQRTHIAQQWRYLGTTLVMILGLLGLLALAVGGLSVLLAGPLHVLIRFVADQIVVATQPGRQAQSVPVPGTVLGRLRATLGVARAVLVQVVGFLLRSKASLAAVAAVGLVTILLKPLRDHLGDVQQYVTYQETDVKYQHKQAILQNTTAVMRHVLRDAHCKRIIVLAHSLGTVIALDTILGLHRPQRLTTAGSLSDETGQMLAKVTHFVTMGSPINKVEYFFATVHSKIPIYLQVVNDLRGDLSTLPFSYDGEPHVHWVNYWDQGDAISGPLHTIVGEHIDIRRQRVDNVRIASYLWPNPAGSHTGYVRNLHVLGDIGDMIFEGKYSFVPNEPQAWLEDIYRPQEQAGIQDWQRVGLVSSLLVGTVALYGFLLWFIDQHPLFAELVVLTIMLVIVAPFMWGLVQLIARLRGQPVNQSQPPLGGTDAPTAPRSNTGSS